MENRLSTEILLKRYGGAVPRYTSYPSAVQFISGGGHPLLEENTRDKELSVYVHIPFCRTLCSYCGCTTRAVSGDGPVKNYVEKLEQEIRLAGALVGSRVRASQVHFGGGSPNLLDVRALEELIELIDIYFNIAEGAEIAIEADPRQMTREKTLGYARSGINRVSLGVQDFQLKTQAAINRVQPFSQVEACVSWLHEAGIGGINFDLMYGLPCQTVQTVSDNARKAISLEPGRVAVFGYAHVPWMRPHQKILERHALPGALDRYRQAEAARRIFMENGYESVGMDHFAQSEDNLAAAARERRLRRNFQGYTTDGSNTLIGLGLSSISRSPDGYAQNTTSFKTYTEKLDAGELPVEKSRRLSAEDRLRADVIEQIMCYLAVDTEDICQKHRYPGDYLSESIEALRPMVEDGLVRTEGALVTVMETGRPFVRSVCAAFDAYFAPVEKRHAAAV